MTQFIPWMRNYIGFFLSSFGAGTTSLHFLQTTDWYCRWRCEKKLENSFVEPVTEKPVPVTVSNLLSYLNFWQFFICRNEEAKVLHEKYFSSPIRSPSMLLFCNPSGYGNNTLVLEAAALRRAKRFGTILTKLKPDVTETKLAIESTIDSLLPTPLFNHIFPISKQKCISFLLHYLCFRYTQSKR